MSRTPSGVSAGAGVQVATRPTSGVYTALGLIACVALLVAIIVTIWSATGTFGWSVPFGDEFDKSNSRAQAALSKDKEQLDQIKSTLSTLDANALPGGAAANANTGSNQE